jgi:DNA-binding NarL/FixJ family response regulator
MKEYFSHNGFIVDTASDVEEAEMVHSRSPETRIVILTAYGSSEIEDEARLLGADAFLRKPQPLSQVAQVVRGLIESPRRTPPPA